MLLVKFIVLLLLGFIVVSLFFGLYYMVNDKGQTNRTVNALSVRIGLSILAIVVVIIAGATGVIELNPSPLTGNVITSPAGMEPGSQTADEEIAQPSSGGGRRLIVPAQ